jgi:large subunit ribosomal protein L24
LNDNVLVITGKDAGKQGKVIATSPKSGKVTVQGVNLQKKNKKARRANEVSQIVEQEGAIDVSNVMVVCDACSKPVRVKYSVVDGKKVRVCPKCGAVLDKAYAGKGKKAETVAEDAPKKRTRKRAAKKEAEETTATEDKAE